MAKFRLAKQYDHKVVEERLYSWWEQKGFFTPEIVPGVRPFVISMPPPNVTGELHLGHAMFVATEDLMVRHARMRGLPTLWLPGTDHAGIATQLQVEKYLLGRDAFLQKTWKWKEKFGGIITQQLRKLGASCDWTRERFTLDEGLSRAVREAFVRLYEKGLIYRRLYEKGLIYRGAYLINWSPGLRTAVSDLEVEYHEEQGTLYTFKYPLEGGEEYIPVATTRPETILGDTAVAVHPEDDRYRKYIGKTCLVPMLNRRIPVITRPRRLRDWAAPWPADFERAQSGCHHERECRALRRPGPVRMPEEALAGHGSGRPDAQDRGLYDANSPQPARG